MTTDSSVPGITMQDRDRAGRMADALADILNSLGFDVRVPAQPGSSFLQLTNVRAAVCELTIYDSGVINWEYRRQDNSRSGTATLAAMALSVLSGEASKGTFVPAPHDPQTRTLIGLIGRALIGQGMIVELNVLDRDEQSFEVYSEIAIMNPGHPERGSIHIDDDGLLNWYCQVSDAGHPGGLDLEAVVRTLTETLAIDSNSAGG
jgi:hypothetical protein